MSESRSPTYIIQVLTSPPAWEGPLWRDVPAAMIDHFHARSADHRPRVEFRVLADPRHVRVLFDVDDRWVVARHAGHQQNVYEDSCVEFFVRPRPDRGYFNFEVNCGGSILLYYIEDWTPVGDGYRRYCVVPVADVETADVFHTLPSRVEPEIAGPVHWRLGLSVPLSLLEKYVGPLGSPTGQQWGANFYKCADRCSKPHWAAWAPIGEELNFHQPRYFGTIEFVEP